MALPPPRLPVPPHQLSPPRVGHGSSPLKFCVSVCPSKPFFHEFLPLHLRWPFTAQPTGCVRTLWPWWPCCSCCWRHGSNTDCDDGARWSLRQTGDKKKKTGGGEKLPVSVVKCEFQPQGWFCSLLSGGAQYVFLCYLYLPLHHPVYLFLTL